MKSVDYKKIRRDTRDTWRLFGSCLALKVLNFFEELRPERPKAHSPGQGEQRELTPWVCSIPTTWRPERAQALNHKIVWVVITDFCRAFALSGRNLCVGHLSQGIAPCSRLPWAERYCPFRARNDRAFCEFCGFRVKIQYQQLNRLISEISWL